MKAALVNRESDIEWLAGEERKNATYQDLIDALDSGIKHEGQPFLADLEDVIQTPSKTAIEGASRVLAISLLEGIKQTVGGEPLNDVAYSITVDTMTRMISDFVKNRTAHETGALFSNAVDRYFRRVAERKVG